MADSTLAAIRTKIRRLTRSPSESQITTAEIDEYINTFVLYDFPEELRLFSLRKTLTFYTKPNVDTYETNAIALDPLQDFKDSYITTHEPVYVSGNQAVFCQSREKFFAMYPFTSNEQIVDTGDGGTVLFSGTLSAIPVLTNKVLFSSVDLNGDPLTVYDDGVGTFDGDGAGTIDYVTGAYSITFTTAPGSSENIYAQTVPYKASRPTAMLYFDNKFTMRPVPDKAYAVNLEVYKRPTELLNSSDSPELEQWWQYIAYGSAKKVFEDRTDMDSVALIMPEFNKQEILVLRRTIVQQTKERVATIYTEQSGSDGFFGTGNSNY